MGTKKKEGWSKGMADVPTSFLRRRAIYRHQQLSRSPKEWPVAAKTTANSGDRSVPYYGQQPHVQGKSLHPLMCFSWNLKNAFRRAFSGPQECRKRKEMSRIDCLLDLINFDINQLLIYENRNTKHRKECVAETLRIMKMKVNEVKSLAGDSKCLDEAEAMLKRRGRLKCVSRSFRRQLIDHMANFDPSEISSQVMCEVMKQLDRIDADINNLCSSSKQSPKEESYSALVKETLCSEKVEDDCKMEMPAVCAEVTRPYDPRTDDDANSIHLRYIPELDSFKADMSQNPRAMRLPLMCPSMKRIMNKMKPSYLMDDVPCKMDVSSGGRHLTGFVRSPVSQSKGTNCIPKSWVVASHLLCRLYA